MSQRQELIDYLNGDSQTDQARARLASEGPRIVPQLLEALLDVLKALGRYAAAQASSFDAENQIDRAASRASKLVVTIASASAYHDKETAAKLIEGIHHANPSIRALAVMLGIPISDIALLQAIVQCFADDAEYLPKLAASIYLMAVADSTDRISSAAHRVASDWISQVATRKWKQLVRKVNYTSGNEDESTRRAIIGMGAMFREIAAS